jgi:hypothetical protein
MTESVKIGRENVTTVKLGYNELLGTGQICSFITGVRYNREIETPYNFNRQGAMVY